MSYRDLLVGIISEISVGKPDDWPCNHREVNLEVIAENAIRFIEQPDYINKEHLFSSIDLTDTNQVNELGTLRTCDYEVALINALYQIGGIINCVSLKVYLYGHIARLIQVHKTMVNAVSIFGEHEEYDIQELHRLWSPLLLFYYCYSDYCVNKQRLFSDSIIKTTKRIFNNIRASKNRSAFCYSYNMLLYDLGFSNSTDVFPYLCFDRNELQKLFELSAQINKKEDFDSVGERTLESIIRVSLRQWVLRSRNDYKTTFFYKSISESNVLKAFDNHEVWMSITEKLNDKREQKVIKGLFANKKWLKYDWAKQVEIDKLDDCFVCSFSKEAPTDKMKKEYGGVVLGYKSDRIANILSPVINIAGLPYFDQVVFYDILYNETEAKDEINFLCDLVNKYDFDDHEKTMFLSELLAYWSFSFKDIKWQGEKERRYQLFIDKRCDYYDERIEDGFFKIKSSLYLYPDFLFCDNERIKIHCRKRIEEKLSVIATKSYMFCKNCLQADFSAANGLDYSSRCTICGSNEIEVIEK